jgi:hypothetical protein
MGLKIATINEDHVHGTLDGVLEFEISKEGEGVVARIHNWTRKIGNRSVHSVNCMRSAAYEALARYREDQRLA